MRTPERPTAHYAVAVEDLAAKEPPELDVHLEALPEMPSDLGSLAGPLHADVHMELRGPHLLMKAKAQGDLSLVCHRCLKDFAYHTDLRIDEHMVVQDELPTEEIEWEADTVSETIPPNGSLDLVDWLRQHLILNLPAKQLCDAACAVPQSAEQGETRGDPRWAALQQLQQPKQGDDHGTT